AAASNPAAPSAPQQPTSAAAGIVQEVVEARSIGLVLCGCAGSGQEEQQQQPEATGGEDGAVAAGTNPLFGGTRSAHGKGPSVASVGGFRNSLGAGGRSGPLSLMTRSWHGKSRHHTRWSYRSAREAAANSGGSDRPGSTSRHSGLASVVEEMINNALRHIVGDVATVLLASDPAPAVLAVRASMPIMSATV
ncbi:unnamed protein product, partial [Scytosiphon promiscuus]